MSIEIRQWRTNRQNPFTEFDEASGLSWDWIAAQPGYETRTLYTAPVDDAKDAPLSEAEAEATESLRAEVERLEAVSKWESEQHDSVLKEARALIERAVQLCGERDAYKREAQRLAEALLNIRRAALDGCSAMDCARDAYDALALEDRNG